MYLPASLQAKYIVIVDHFTMQSELCIYAWTTVTGPQVFTPLRVSLECLFEIAFAEDTNPY